MSVIHYEDEKFKRLFESLKFKNKEMAYIWNYPEGWNQFQGMNGVVEAFVQDLRLANTITWNRQYPDSIAPLVRVKLGGCLPYANDFELLKSLRGVRYNLVDNAGVESNLRDCNEKLKAVIEHVMSDIIGKIPAYDAAETW